MLLPYFLFTFFQCLFAMTTDSAQDSAYYFGAVMVFSYKGSQTGQNISFGSESPTDEVGKYGFHSPIEPAMGLVVRALDKYGAKDGCRASYDSVKEGDIWIALISRGNCTFMRKIELAMKKNASAVVVYDNVAEKDLTLMSHEGANGVPSVMTSLEIGRQVDRQLDDGQTIYANIKPGEQHRTNLLEKASIVFVSISFMILMVISLAWLVFYYVQRFRLIQNQHRGQQRQFVTAKKAITKIPLKTLKNEDKEIAQEQTCIICLDKYKPNDILRLLDCGHAYHRKCIDPWLLSKQTCPMCKFDIVKGCEASTSATNINTTEEAMPVVHPPNIEAEYEVIDETVADEDPIEEIIPQINVVVVTTLQPQQQQKQRKENVNTESSSSNSNKSNETEER